MQPKKRKKWLYFETERDSWAGCKIIKGIKRQLPWITPTNGLDALEISLLFCYTVTSNCLLKAICPLKSALKMDAHQISYFAACSQESQLGVKTCLFSRKRIFFNTIREHLGVIFQGRFSNSSISQNLFKNICLGDKIGCETTCSSCLRVFFLKRANLY